MLVNIVQCVLFLSVTGYAVVLFWQVVYRRYLYIKLGQPVQIEKEIKFRLKAATLQIFGQTKLLKDPKSGIMHMIIFYGFLILQLGALDIILLGTIGRGLPIPGYDVFGFIQEITVALILVAMSYAAYRRYGEKLIRLKRGWKPSLVVFFIFSLMLFVLLTLGFHRAEEGLPPSGLAPVSSLIAALIEGVPHLVTVVGFYAAWWMHLIILLSFLVYVPQSKHFHLITAPVNILFQRTSPVGRLKKLDLEDEDAESFGAGKIEDFNRKQINLCIQAI
jgi:hypothetical protein